MKLSATATTLVALAALSTPTVMFGAAADLNACCTPGDQDMPKSGGNLGNQSYSSLSQVNRSNISQLGPVWKTSTSAAAVTQPTPRAGAADTGQQTTPVVVDGVIYADTPAGGVIAVNGANGAVKWKWEPTTASGAPFGTTGTRRGVSVGAGKVYTLAAGNRVVALDKDTGALVWAVQPTGPNGASLGNIAKVGTIYHDGMVFVGTNDGSRNAAFAVRASDGGMLWSFYGGAEPGRIVTDVNGVRVDAGATWGPLQPNGQSCALTSGTSPWLHGAVDPELGIFYVTFGNVRSCQSSQDGQQRPGDNLFGNSLVALDMRTGAYKWHHQSVRHDIFDMDNVHSPVLADVSVGGQTRKAIYYGSKAHMTFILDRTNGKPLTGAIVMKPMVVDTRQNNAPTQPFPAHGTWVDTLGPGPDECIVWEKLGTDNIPGNPWRGVPNYNGYQPDAQGNLVYTEPNYLDVDKPFVQYPGGYNPRGEAQSQPHRQGCLWEPHFDFPVLTMSSQNGGADLSNHGYSPRTNLYYVPYGVAPVAHYRSAGSNGLRALGEYQTGGVFAINASTGKLVWQNHLGLDAAHGQGVLATAGDLLFASQPDGMLYALDATNGKTLWKFQTDGEIEGAVTTYSINGEQYVLAIAEGDKLWAFKLGGSYKSASGSSEMPTPAPFVVRRAVGGSAVEGSTLNNTVYLARPNRTDVAASVDSIATNGMSPTFMRVPVGTTVTFTNPGPAQMPNFPNQKMHCATQFFEGLFNPKLAPGESFQYTFTKEGEYFFNDCTDPRPTGKVVAYHVPQDVPGALQLVPSTLNMRAANGVFTSVQGLVTTSFKVPAGYTRPTEVRLKTPLSTMLFPAVTATLSGDGRTLVATFDKALIDNNMPAGDAVPLTLMANFMNAGAEKQLTSTATVRVIK
ncbi:PQQ-binding-like beta-propeller repeat protein [Piscinibacter koreensis]|uniref:PQQ-binding-like beta-propeller repeat protein n=1 Tax=Piscinibacter koreensis TaxID=2742824 RepID=A0A7Y6TX13_9BURK|nr:PQQ-binding-like beta-propeller repeat protein [Schlegelella koreensis]NUZ06617.1 PQQ-binding-like beta-propeller repeat protein [Schlegelella koreensis]